MAVIGKLLTILLLTYCALATPRMRVYMPYGDVDTTLFGSFDDRAQEVDRAKRIFRNLTGVKLRIKKVRYCNTFENNFAYFHLCSSWSATPSQCIRAIYDRINNNGYSRRDGVAHYLVANPMYHNGTYWFMGAAQVQCYRDIKLFRNFGIIAGIGYGHFLKTQINGQTRIPQSVAIMIHEWGHLILGLTHDEPEDNFIMNSLFNVKGFSSQSAPEMWRFSEKSKNEIRRCKNGK